MNGNLYSKMNMSQEDIILSHLITYGKITNKECCEIYGFRHLPSVIRYLRRKDIKIVNNHNYGKNRFGTNIYWVDYVLAPNKEQNPKVVSMIERLKNRDVVGVRACQQ